MNNILKANETAQAIYTDGEYSSEISFLSESSIKGFLYIEFVTGKKALVNKDTIERIIKK